MTTMQTTYAAIGRSMQAFAEQDQRSEFINVFMTLCGHIDQVTKDLEETEDPSRRTVLEMRLGVLNKELNKMRREQDDQDEEV